MTRPSQISLMEALLEYRPDALKKAELAEQSGKAGRAVYYRGLAEQAAVIYAWMKGDDTRRAVAEHEKADLERSIDALDEQLLAYKIEKAQRELAAERAA